MDLGLAEVHRLQSEPGAADSHWGLTEVHRVRNQYDEAIESYLKALHIRTEIGDRQGRADALWGLAEVYRFRGGDDEAIAFHSEALQIYTDIGNRQGRASALWGLAHVRRLRDEYDEAMTPTPYKFATIYDTIHGCKQAAAIFNPIGNTEAATRALKDAADVRRLLQREEAL
ncbi:hypothetical protein M407DRAFT_34949 [Tulasnella calospora MUT 4182]|uniref:Uncharacterized protein n=1 Tax=Tulasnella calospora MUT 4182 TaxID=1051891 RepID=A0A0C3K227_9AGAM|nr:hypothetical protein M407DRAFT_34949 [Tulasnella calospora MUT 4182]